MFQIKICGVTTAADARLVAEAGADCIGLNFVAGSPRSLTLAAAREVAAAIPAGVLRVGVFAGSPAADILRIVASVGLGAIQLHGHLQPTGSGGQRLVWDPPSLCGELGGVPIIRAVRLEGPPASDGLAAARAWLDAASEGGNPPSMVICDAAVERAGPAGQLGGTGAVVDWSLLVASGGLGVPMALAGGLTPHNVAAAIRATGLHAVDTASGVESAPGRKDPERVQAFVAAARGALGIG